MLETIAISGLPIKERSNTYYELEVNSDVTDLIACCNALNLQKLLSADILELKSKKTQANSFKSLLTVCMNLNLSKNIRYGHVAFEKNARKLRYFRYASLMRTGYDLNHRRELVLKLKLELPRRYKIIANLIYALPVSLMEGLTASTRVTSLIINKSKALETSQGFIDFELVLLAWSKLLFPRLKTISVQHGGGYHHRFHPSLSERIEVAYSDFCYNWVGLNCSKNTAIPFPNDLKITCQPGKKIKSIQRIVVLSTYEGDGCNNLIQNKSAPQTKQEICEFKKFICQYTGLIEKTLPNCDLVFRPPPKCTGYIESLNENWQVCDHYKSLADYHDGKTLFIIDNLNTTLYQLLDAELPFIFIHNRRMYGTNENFENFLRDYMPKNSYFDKLQDFEMYLNAFCR